MFKKNRKPKFEVGQRVKSIRNSGVVGVVEKVWTTDPGQVKYEVRWPNYTKTATEIEEDLRKS